jgi:hypothetical protein
VHPARKRCRVAVGLSQPERRDENDDGWKKPLLLMVVFTSIPVVIIAVAFAVHSFS